MQINKRFCFVLTNAKLKGTYCDEKDGYVIIKDAELWDGKAWAKTKNDNKIWIGKYQILYIVSEE